MAVQRRETILVPPQPLLMASLSGMVAEPQVSGAVAVPVLLVEVSAGQSSTRSGGTSTAGGVLSRTWICWTQVLLFPQSSVAVQVRLNTLMRRPGGPGGWGVGGTGGGCGWGGG